MLFLKTFYFFLFFLFSYKTLGFDPGKDSQFIGYFLTNSKQGLQGLNLEDPQNSIVLIYNQGWGKDTSKSKYVIGRDKCYVDFYKNNKPLKNIGNKGPWYSLASEYRNIIQGKKIFLYYF